MIEARREELDKRKARRKAGVPKGLAQPPSRRGPSASARTWARRAKDPRWQKAAETDPNCPLWRALEIIDGPDRLAPKPRPEQVSRRRGFARVEVGVMFDLAANGDPRLTVGERRKVVSRLGRELAKGWRAA